MPAENENPHGK